MLVQALTEVKIKILDTSTTVTSRKFKLSSTYIWVVFHLVPHKPDGSKAHGQPGDVETANCCQFFTLKHSFHVTISADAENMLII